MLTADKPNELRKRYARLRKELATVHQAIGDAKSQRHDDATAQRNKDPVGFRQHCSALRARQQKADAEFETFLVLLEMPDGDEKEWRRTLHTALKNGSERLGKALYQKELTSYLDEKGDEVPVFWKIETARKEKQEIEIELDKMVFGLILKRTAL